VRSGQDLTPKALDKDLDRVGFLGDAAEAMGRRLIAPGLAICFLAVCAILASLQFAASDVSSVLILVTGATVGGYLAITIGANDVANNVGPAVGARVVSITTALIIAAICESAGALLAGGDVVNTISTEIIAPDDIPENFRFMKAMLTAMAAAAIWINIATLVGAPVSTTHTIIGGVVGAGVAASSFAAINWSTLGVIAATWVASPFLGGIVAALLLAFINAKVIYTDDKLSAARFWLPILLGGLAATFTAYMTHKGLHRLIVLPFIPATLAPIVVGAVVWAIYRRVVASQALFLDNRTQSLRSLFAIPLICSAALLSFAHGANDVANAIGPLAAIVNSQSDEINDLHYWILGQLNPVVPLWVSAVGAFGISAGLLLFGRRLVTVVGKRITKLNPIRAFCVTLATSGTVLTASGLGLPVSSTHIAVGAIFGVGLFREWYRNRFVPQKVNGKRHQPIRNREERRRRLLVRRTNLVTIIGAWIVTVPACALLSAGLFHVFDYLLGTQ
jgi:PiT family inorganic phosphate transporter